MKELITLFTKDSNLINIFNELNLQLKHYDHAAINMIADFTGLTFIDFETEEFIKLNDSLCKLNDIQRIIISNGKDLKFLKEHQASSVGAEGYLKKPLTKELLLDIINEFSSIQEKSNSDDLNINRDDLNEISELRMATEVREIIIDHNKENTQFFNLIDSDDNKIIQRNFDIIFGKNKLYKKLSINTDDINSDVNIQLFEDRGSLEMLDPEAEDNQTNLTNDSQSSDSDDFDFDLSVDFDSETSTIEDNSEDNCDLSFDVSEPEVDDSNIKISLIDDNESTETFDDDLDLVFEENLDIKIKESDIELSKEINNDELSFDLSDNDESVINLESEEIDTKETKDTEKLNDEDIINFDLEDDNLDFELDSNDEANIDNGINDFESESVVGQESDDISFELGSSDVEDQSAGEANGKTSFLQKRSELADYLDEEIIEPDDKSNETGHNNDLTNENITAEFELSSNIKAEDLDLDNNNIDLSITSLDDVENNFDEDEHDIHQDIEKIEKDVVKDSSGESKIFEVKVEDNIVDKESFILDDNKLEPSVGDHTVTATSTVTKHLRSFDVNDQKTLDIDANELLNGLKQNNTSSNITNDENIFLKYKEDEIVRLTHLINDLKNERTVILSEINDLNDKVASYKRSDLSFRTELDELKVENRVLKRRYEEDFHSFNFNFKKLQDELTIKSEKVKLLNEDFEALRSTSFIDIQRVKEKEKSLESKLELINIDSSSQIKLREERILDLKRTVDQLEFNMETLLINEQKLKTENLELNNQLDRVMNSLKGSIQNIEQGHEFIEFRGNKNKDEV